MLRASVRRDAILLSFMAGGVAMAMWLYLATFVVRMIFWKSISSLFSEIWNDDDSGNSADAALPRLCRFPQCVQDFRLIRNRESPCTRCYTAILTLDLYVDPTSRGHVYMARYSQHWPYQAIRWHVTGGPLPCTASLRVVSTHYPSAPFLAHTYTCIAPRSEVKRDGSSSSHTLLHFTGLCYLHSIKVVGARTRLLYSHSHRRLQRLGRSSHS